MFTVTNVEQYTFIEIREDVARKLLDAFPNDECLIEAVDDANRERINECLMFELVSSADYLNLQQCEAIRAWGIYCISVWGGE